MESYLATTGLTTAFRCTALDECGYLGLGPPFRCHISHRLYITHDASLGLSNLAEEAEAK